MPELALREFFPDTTPLIYGCMGLGGGWNQSVSTAADIKKAQEVIETCLEKGINTFDLADIYSLGKAEGVVGEVLKSSPNLRDKMLIQSKVGIKLGPNVEVKQYDLSASYITKAVEDSLNRLGLEQLDILFLHRPDPLMDLDETAAALTKMRSQGKFKHLAVSNMHAGQIAWIQSALDFPIVANQLELSLAHADFVEEGITANMKESCQSGFPRGTLEYCEQQSVQIQAWGALAQGSYTGNTPDNPSEAQLATIKLVKQLATRYSTNANAIVLAWLMKHPVGIQPVLGSTNIERIIECSQAPKIELSRDDWYLLFEASRGQEVP